MSKIFNFNFKQNFKTGFSKPALIGDALALLTPVLYTVVPTFLKLSGTVAALVGGGLPYLIGKALNVPSMCHAAIGITAQHFLYVKGGGIVNDLLGAPIWSLREINGTPDTATTTSSPLTPGTTSQINGLRGFQRVSANGDSLMAYSPNEIARQAAIVPEDPGTSTINDFVRVASPGALADNGINWDDEAGGSGW